MKTVLTLLLIAFLFFSCKSHNASAHKQKSLQDSLAFELCQIHGLDQGVRLSKAYEAMPKTDTFNFNKAVKFVKENGYPTKKLLGEKNFKHECVKASFFALLLHNPQRLVNEKEYFDLFLNEVKKGNMTSIELALILDKYYWSVSKNKNSRRVFYGSQFGNPCIQTKEATNKARIEIGLKPLEDKDFIDCGNEELNMPKTRI